MSQFISLGSDVKGFNTNAPIPSTLVYGALVPNAPTNLTVPQLSNPQFKNWEVWISVETAGDVFVNFNGTASPPLSGTFTPTNSPLNATVMKRVVKPGSTISFFAVANTYVTVEFFEAP